MKFNKPSFFYGLGDKASLYKTMQKYVNIVPIDWNNVKIHNLKTDIVIGFSFGGIWACEYTLKHKIKTLILCSMTTGVESLDMLKVDEVIFIAGENEKWVIKDIKRLSKTLKCKWRLIIVPNAEHKLSGEYRQVLTKLIRELQ